MVFLSLRKVSVNVSQNTMHTVFFGVLAAVNTQMTVSRQRLPIGKYNFPSVLEEGMVLFKNVGTLWFAYFRKRRESERFDQHYTYVCVGPSHR